MRKILSPEGVLPFNARAIQGMYGVVWHYSRTQTRICYEVDLELGGRSSHKFYRLLLDRKNVFVENPPEHGKIYTLSTRMTEGVYPLYLYLNRANELVAVINHAEVVYRTERIVRALREYYPDKPARRCLERFEADMASPNLAKAIEHDPFFRLYFYPLHVKYSTALTADGTIKLPVNGRCTIFSTTATLIEPDEPSKTIEIKLDGHSPGRLKPSRFSARYLLYDDDHSISSIKGTLQYDSLDGLPCNQTFEVYRLDAEKRVPVKNADVPRKKNSVFIGVEDKPPPAPKGFWNIFS
jgi:hypothetical protein